MYLTPNVLKLSGARRRSSVETSRGTDCSDTAARVRCSALFGVVMVASRDMTGRYACAPRLFNGTALEVDGSR
jgi:hypothetical protein